jgi:hypothetical protein
MKQLPTPASTSRLSMKDATALIQEMFGKDVSTDFDDVCVSSVYFEWNAGICIAFVEYDKLKVTPKGSPGMYCPIQPYKEDLKPEAAQNVLQRKFV